jgi:hypothetical protein
MGLLEFTGEQKMYVPDAYLDVPPVLGERTDVRGDTGFDVLNRAVNLRDVREGWFLYGQPFDKWDFYLPRPELVGWGSLSSSLLLDFWRNSARIGMSGPAMYAAEAIMGLANQPGDGRVMVFRDYFSEWARDDSVTALVGEIHRLLGAHHEDDVLRDDAEDKGAEAYAMHRTEVRLGFSGAIPLLAVKRSYDDDGVLMRCVEIVKTSDKDAALGVLNELSLAEEMRVKRLLAAASPEERRYVLERADRTHIQRDHDVYDLRKAAHYIPQIPRWQKSADSLAGLVRKIVDSRALISLERVVFKGRSGKHEL